MDAAPGSADEEELKLWSLLVERYEQEKFHIDLPAPIEAGPSQWQSWKQVKADLGINDADAE
jgi:antitoxin component HigA of HigAB toxin-antitoxin module